LKIDYKIILAFAAIYIIWGTTYLAIKIGLESMPPFMMATIRYLIAGLFLLILCVLKGESIFSGNVFGKMVLGAFMLLLGQAVLFWAEKYISSGLTAVFGSTLPIFYIIADRRHWKNYFRNKLTLASILMGLIGILILFINPSDHTEPEYSTGMTILASVVCVGSCFCWAAGSLYYKYHKKSGSLFENVGWQLMGGMISCMIVSFATGEWNHFSFHSVTLHALLATIYLAIAGSIIAFIALYWLLGKRPAPVVGTYAYINPVIAVILGYFIANEKITGLQIFGMIIILVAAWLANNVKFKTGDTA
jgi:drug/metabolite transporter (DMT)-like permease